MKHKLQKFKLRFISILTFTAVTLVTSFPAMAEIDFSGAYTGLLFSSSNAKFSDTGGSEEYSSGHIKGKLGWILNDIMSVEGKLGMITKNPDGDEVKDVVSYGVYLRAGKDFGQYKLYGLIGATGIQYRTTDKNTESGGSYGLGLEIFGTKDIAVSFEYLMMLDKTIDGTDVMFDSLGLGFTYYFTEDKSYFNKNRNKIRSIRY